MDISSIALYKIENTLRQPFQNAITTIEKRKTIIVEVKDFAGHIGYGEVVTFEAPWYTSETTEGAWAFLKEWIVPRLLGKSYHHPKAFDEEFHFIKGNQMALAGVETALWDLYAKEKNLPLSSVLGGVRKHIDVGIAIGKLPFEVACNRISSALAQGYSRIKLKVDRKDAWMSLKEIRAAFPEAPFMIDLNGSCTEKDLAMLRQLDDLRLEMIEQPFHEDALELYARCQKELITPICLDESITNLNDLKGMYQEGHGRIAVIKLGRVGGYSKALKMHQFASGHHIPLWVGGMLESGVGRAHNLALATLSGFTIAGDISASDNYYAEDILLEKMVVQQGKIAVPEGAGIGFTINQERLDQLTLEKYVEHV